MAKKRASYTHNLTVISVQATTKKPLDGITAQETVARLVRNAVADAIGQYTPEDQVVVTVKTETLHG